MNPHIRPYVANDNNPLSDMPRGDAVGFNAMLRERQRNRRAQEALELTDTTEPGRPWGLWLSLAIWAGFIGGTIWAFYTSQPIGARIITTIGLIWSGLWTRFLAVDYEKPRLAETALLSTLVGFVGLMMTATLQMGYPMTLVEGVITIISASLLVSAINNSKIALMCAIGSGLIWAALQLDGFMETGNYGLAIPALWALTILQSIRLRSHFGVLISVVTGYIWLTGGSYQAYLAGHLSLLYLGAGAAVIGSLHYRASKAAEDQGLPYAEWSVTFGWLLANIGLLCLASFACDPNHPFWVDSHGLSSMVRLSWLMLMGAAIVIYALAGFARKKHRRMSSFGVILTTACLTALPLGLYFLPFVASQFEAMTNLSLFPVLGYFLFGLVTGHILFFSANAFRRALYFQVIAGLMMASMLAYTANAFYIVQDEHWVIWLLGTFASALIALIAVEPQLSEQSDPDMKVSVSSS